MAYKLFKSTPHPLQPQTFLKPFTPLPTGEYPVFNAYPTHIVNYQRRLIDRIRREEEENEKRLHLAEEVRRLGEELRRDERDWEEREKSISEGVDRWWEGLVEEEKRYKKKERREELFETERRVEGMKDIAEARRSYLRAKLEGNRGETESLKKMVGAQRAMAEKEVGDLRDTRLLEEVEDEWVKRGEEMRKMREMMKGGTPISDAATKSPVKEANVRFADGIGLEGA